MSTVIVQSGQMNNTKNIIIATTKKDILACFMYCIL